METARARLTAIESRLSDRLIKAPFSGVVGLRNISRGAGGEPGDLITTLDDDSVMKLDLAVPSLFVPSLVLGMPVDAVNPEPLVSAHSTVVCTVSTAVSTR